MATSLKTKRRAPRLNGKLKTPKAGKRTTQRLRSGELSRASASAVTAKGKVITAAPPTTPEKSKFHPDMQ